MFTLQQQQQKEVAHLGEYLPHVCIGVCGVELAQQELRRQGLRHEIGHPAAIVAIKHSVQEAVFTSDWTETTSDMVSRGKQIR